MDNKIHISITEFGGKGDGCYDNTSAFSLAFSKPGIIVDIPSGVFLTGPIKISSNSGLNLSPSAILKFIDDPELYPPVYTRWEGVRCWSMHPCIYAENSENISIEGKGIIDGSGEKWWKEAREKKLHSLKPEKSYEKRLALLNVGYERQPEGGGGRKSQFLRPSLIEFNSCKNVRISSVKIMNSPFWTVHPIFSEKVEIENVTIVNPSDTPNTDAIDIDSCKDVHIKGCLINVGDDGLCLKSGAGEDGIFVNIPTESVLIEECTVTSAHGGAVIGSETAAGIKNVTFKNCNFLGTDRGVRVKTRRGRGGKIENILFSHLNIIDSLCPIAFNMYYKCGATDDSLFSLETKEINKETPKIKNITIEGIVAKNCKSSAGFIVGLPESRIENLLIKDSYFSVNSASEIKPKESEMYRGLPDVEEKSIRKRFADIKMENVVVEGVDSLVIEQ